MLRGGDFNKRWSNKLMRARVILQGLAIVLILLTAYLFAN
jgi:Hypoxia induced protein conserved region.|tara:strand:- start:209 stop:328 length:120 start_codon:yes stop_codon:yes gene_type:complete